MNDQSKFSGKTYIEFSFEKSLRKYQMQPHKKIKIDHCDSNKHLSVCQHITKLQRRNSLPSADKKINLYSIRKNYHVGSRLKAKQFSDGKNIKQFGSSNKTSKENNCEINPLSEFDSGQQNNSSHQNDKTILNFSENHSDCKKISFQIKLNSQHTLSRVIQQDKSMGISELLQTINVQSSQKIIQEQNQPLSQIQIVQSCGQRDWKSQLNRNNFPQVIQNVSCLPVARSAYFSSCYSIQPFQRVTDLNFNKKEQEQMQPKQQAEIQVKVSQQSVQKQQSNKKDVKIKYPVQVPTLSSVQQLKQQHLNQQKDHIFHQIQNTKQQQEVQVQEQCLQTPQPIQRQLQNMNYQVQYIQRQACKQENYWNSSGLGWSSTAAICVNKLNQGIVEDGDQYVVQGQYILKRQRMQKQVPLRKQLKKINFQAQHNYKCLGRIRIVGLGEYNQQICLSIRRFTIKSSKPSTNYSICIDKPKIINYLISQRPYLQKSRRQLYDLVTDLIDQQQWPKPQQNLQR